MLSVLDTLPPIAEIRSSVMMKRHGGAMKGSVEDFSEVLSKHICKIGTNLRVFADSYKKQCSAIELLKMLIKTIGFR
ncbi:hypothetical protein JHK82_024527 [Glycine max]|nr:hypothetical protein JHK85_025126 [Glycine max]KAG5133339.1 hypothetical protein JHK82_024527 [Glycine max]